MTLSPGDLCVIVSDKSLNFDGHQIVGMTVVLLRVHECDWCNLLTPHLQPFWEVSPLKGKALSYLCLRKINPDEMTDRIYVPEVIHA